MSELATAETLYLGIVPTGLCLGVEPLWLSRGISLSGNRVHLISAARWAHRTVLNVFGLPMGDGHPQQIWLLIRNLPQHKVSPSVDVLKKSVLPACVDVQVQSDWGNRYKLQLESEVSYPSGSGSPPKDIYSVPGPIAL